MTDQIEQFGTAPDGGPIYRVGLENGGVRAHVLSWGATLQDFRLDGVDHSLMLGSPDPEAYFTRMRYFGAIVGPLANRIAKGQLEIDGQPHTLDRNERDRTTLHGGSEGFGVQNWHIASTSPSQVKLRLHHPDGRSGFPGPISASVTYGLDDGGALTIEIEGQTDSPTVFGPAFHGYWSLDGGPDLSSHLFSIDAERYLPVDEDLIPTGDPARVAGTGFDYRQPRAPDPSLDHNFCLTDQRGPMRHACALEAGGLRLDIETTEPGLQVYTGLRIATEPFSGHEGKPYGRNAGIAIEPQLWPDAPHHAGYPSPALRPGQSYRQVSRFAVTRTD